MANNKLNEMVKKNLLNNLIPMDDEIKESIHYDRIYEIPFEQLCPFRKHTFDVTDDEEMEYMVETIKQSGKLLEPAVVRKLDTGMYEIISGHRRKRASELAGLDSLTCIVSEMSDDEAVMQMAIANFARRKKIKHSEKARTYSLLYETIKHQGVKDGEQSINQIADKVGDSAKKVQRYIRLSSLNASLLKMVDEGKIGFIAAVDIAVLNDEQQEWLVDFIGHGAKVSTDKAKKINETFRNGNLNKFTMTDILFSNDNSSTTVINIEEVREYFPEEYSEDEMKEVIVSLLIKWNKGV